uniref:Uncharacterized protein n=1 Tax=Arundo donax TaxID=35708 RepID=A0A0A9BMG9_ARUDO
MPQFSSPNVDQNTQKPKVGQVIFAHRIETYHQIQLPPTPGHHKSNYPPRDPGTRALQHPNLPRIPRTSHQI